MILLIQYHPRSNANKFIAWIHKLIIFLNKKYPWIFYRLFTIHISVYHWNIFCLINNLFDLSSAKFEYIKTKNSSNFKKYLRKKKRRKSWGILLKVAEAFNNPKNIPIEVTGQLGTTLPTDDYTLWNRIQVYSYFAILFFRMCVWSHCPLNPSDYGYVKYRKFYVYRTE